MCARNVRSTCSRSCRRSRPVSTKMQVSWSPIALCTSAAATDESTPPDRPQITCRSPTMARIFSTSSSMKCPGVQSAVQPQTSKRKFSMISAPRTVCATSAWNCTAWMGLVAWRKPATTRSVRAVATYPGGTSST